MREQTEKNPIQKASKQILFQYKTVANIQEGILSQRSQSLLDFSNIEPETFLRISFFGIIFIQALHQSCPITVLLLLLVLIVIVCSGRGFYSALTEVKRDYYNDSLFQSTRTDQNRDFQFFRHCEICFSQLKKS